MHQYTSWQQDTCQEGTLLNETNAMCRVEQQARREGTKGKSLGGLLSYITLLYLQRGQALTPAQH